MPQPDPTQVVTDALVTPVVTETPKTAEQLATEAAEAAAKVADDAIAALPEEFAWVGKELKNLRRESGGYRTKLREQEELFKGAVTADDHQAAILKARANFAELTLKDALRENDLPEGAAALIQGSSPEETYAKASALAAVLAGAPVPVVKIPQTPTELLHAGFGPQGGAPKPLSGRESYRAKHKRN